MKSPPLRWEEPQVVIFQHRKICVRRCPVCTPWGVIMCCCFAAVQSCTRARHVRALEFWAAVASGLNLPRRPRT